MGIWVCPAVASRNSSHHAPASPPPQAWHNLFSWLEVSWEARLEFSIAQPGAKNNEMGIMFISLKVLGDGESFLVFFC